MFEKGEKLIGTMQELGYRLSMDGKSEELQVPDFCVQTIQEYRNNIDQHMRSLRAEKTQEAMSPFLKKLLFEKKEVKNAKLFAVDLNLIKVKLDTRYYKSVDEIISDIKQVCSKYESKSSTGSRVDQVEAVAAAFVKKVLQKHAKEMGDKRRTRVHCCLDPSICSECPLCKRACIAYESIKLSCAGPSCSRVIKRNEQYYTYESDDSTKSDDNFCYCKACYNKNKSEEMKVGELVILKSQMTRKKNDEVFSEPWVQCGGCEKWCHQVCALSLDCSVEGSDAEFTCGLCELLVLKSATEKQKGKGKQRRKKKSGATTIAESANSLSATSLSHTPLS